MKKPLLKFLVTATFVALFVYYYITNPEAVTSLKSVGIVFVLVTLVFQLSSLIINDLVIKTVIKRMGTHISFREGLYAAFISSFGNYFLPLTGGAALRAVYLKRNHNFSYKNFVISMYGMYIINFLSTSLVALFCVGYIYLVYGIAVPLLAVIMLALLVATLSLSSSKIRLDIFVIKLISKIKLKSVVRLLGKVEKIVDGWKHLSKDKRLLGELVLYTSLNAVIRAVFYFVAFKYLGLGVGIIYVLLYNVLISLSLYLTITPGSLGIRESILLFFGTAAGLKHDSILSVNLVDRASMILLLLIMFVIFNFVFKEGIKVPEE